MSWLKQKLFYSAIPIGAIFSIICVLGVAFGMEFKDKQYKNEFDWLDVASVMLGGLIGQIIQVILYYVIF